MNIVKELKKLKIGKVVSEVELKDYTTYKVGGKALALVYPDDISSLKKLITFIKDNNVKYKVLGNGSNVIFDDEGYDGIIIKLTKFNHLDIDDVKIVVGAGYNLVKLAYKVINLGLAGLEFACGIPGSIGGAVFMNAGAYKSDMGYIVSDIKVLTPSLEIKTLYNKDLNFHYRTSFLKEHPEFICLEATIILRHGDIKLLKEIIEDRKQRRLLTQPLEYPSAGSVFRNPSDDYAGRLIEDIGYKGHIIGGAMVSEKHANFIINKGGATSSDIKKLIAEIQSKVKKKFDVDLILEQEIVE